MEIAKVRRGEFTVKPEAAKDFLARVHWGTLSLVDVDGSPYAVPLSYGLSGDTVVFHGSRAGRKARAVRDDVWASLTVAQPYSFIPPDWNGKQSPCGATQFFKSVIVEGPLKVVSDEQGKRETLSLLMSDFGHTAALSAFPSAMINATFVWCLNIQKLGSKFKFGQNLESDEARSLADFLHTRNEGPDRETAKEIIALHPSLAG